MKPHIAEALDEELAFREHRDGSGGVLHIDGRDVSLRLLTEEGSFATVYRAVDPPHDVYSFLHPTVEDKDIAATVHRKAPKNPHIPAVEYLGHVEDVERNVYQMPYYNVPPPSRSKAEEDRNRLWACNESVKDEELPDTRTRADALLQCAQRWDVTPSVIEALNLLAKEAAKRADNYVFEFQDYNTATDEHGNLVLLDVLYSEAFP